MSSPLLQSLYASFLAEFDLVFPSTWTEESCTKQHYEQILRFFEKYQALILFETDPSTPHFLQSLYIRSHTLAQRLKYAHSQKEKNMDTRE